MFDFLLFELRPFKGHGVVEGLDHTVVHVGGRTRHFPKARGSKLASVLAFLGDGGEPEVALHILGADDAQGAEEPADGDLPSRRPGVFRVFGNPSIMETPIGQEGARMASDALSFAVYDPLVT